MTSAKELARIVEEGERGQDGAFYAITLGDGDALVSIARSLATFAARQSGVTLGTAGVDAIAGLAEWLEAQLALDGGLADPEAVVSLFRPFLSPRDLITFLDDSGVQPSQLASRAIASAATYAEAVIATWGSDALAAAEAIALPTSQRSILDGVAREILAVCGACAIPIALATLPLEGPGAYQAISALALTLDRLRMHLGQPAEARTGGGHATGPADQLRAELERLLRQKLAEIQAVSVELPSSPSSNGVRADRFAAIGYVGALLELRATCVELEETLAHTFISKHKFASRLGIKEPLLIDQNPRLQKLKVLGPKVHDWITDALALAARDPTSPNLAHAVDRIAVTLGAMETQRAIIDVTEALIDKAEDPGLWKDLEPLARNLESMIAFLQADADFEDVRGSVQQSSEDAHILVQSYKWSRLILQAILDATDVLLAIETGGRMGGVGPSLRSTLATAGGRMAGSAIAVAEIDRLLAGAIVVAMAASGRDPQKGRRKGVKAEEGLGLSRHRPRDAVPSLTGTASGRFPDRMVFRTFWEVKNVLNLRLTWQLSDFMVYAQATGMKLVLYIRPVIKGAAKAGTNLSPALRDAIKILRREGLIEIRYLKVF